MPSQGIFTDSIYFKTLSKGTHILLILLMLTQLLDDGEEVGMCFLDLCKASDVVNQSFLCTRLAVIGMAAPVVDWINSFLTYLSFQVHIRDGIRTEAAVPSVIRQGTVIWPHHFLFMMNATKMGGNSVDVGLNAAKSQHLQFGPWTLQCFVLTLNIGCRRECPIKTEILPIWKGFGDGF